jgi:hypothetical protein
LSSGKRETGIGNIILLIVFIIGGILIGGLIASVTKNVQFLSWLGYSKTFGLDVSRPPVINLSVLRLAIGFEISLSVAQVLCLLGAVLLYRRIR